MPPISTVIIAQNEAHRLERCIRSCQPFSHEVLVVDGGSTDDTRELAEGLGCRVIENAWPGYAAQRNLGAQSAANDWIFAIDSDEATDEPLRAALDDARRSTDGERAAYSVHRVNGFMEDWLTESPEKLVRLYDRRRASFTTTRVHEVVDVPVADTESLPGNIWHDNHHDLVDATRGLNLYTSLEAEAAAEQRDMRVWRVFVRPLMRFGQRYVLQRAFRHGWRGLFLALHWTYWELLREMKVYELRSGRRGRPDHPR